MRHIAAIFLAFFISVFLFIIMNIMITTPARNMAQNEGKARNIFLSANTHSRVSPQQQKPRLKPIPKEHLKVELKPKPIKDDIQIEAPKISQSSVKIALKPVKLEELKHSLQDLSNANLHNEKVDFSNPIYESVDSTLAIKQVQPRYPRRAKKRGIEGFVTCDFKINPSGEVLDIVIKQSQPKGVFDKAATKALKQWKFTSFDPKKKYKISSARFNFGVEK